MKTPVPGSPASHAPNVERAAAKETPAATETAATETAATETAATETAVSDTVDPARDEKESAKDDAAHTDAAAEENNKERAKEDGKEGAKDDGKNDDPRELRFQLRRARRKLKETEVQTERLKKMVGQEAIERTRLTIALKEAAERSANVERELIELRREYRDTTRDVERWREATQQVKRELESFRERRKKEREEAQLFGLGTVIQELLPVFDHMELAITHAESDPGRIVEGVQMVMDQLDQTFVRMGIERVEVRRGQPFLPERHEAMLHIEHDDLPHGSLVEELRPGYILNGRLLRAARVSVSARVAAPVPPPEVPAVEAILPAELLAEDLGTPLDPVVAPPASAAEPVALQVDGAVEPEPVEVGAAEVGAVEVGAVDVDIEIPLFVAPTIGEPESGGESKTGRPPVVEEQLFSLEELDGPPSDESKSDEGKKKNGTGGG